MKNKPIIYYSEVRECAVGQRALLLPTVDHAAWIPLSGFVRTSVVERFDKARGLIETKNTQYVPLNESVRIAAERVVRGPLYFLE